MLVRFYKAHDDPIRLAAHGRISHVQQGIVARISQGGTLGVEPESGHFHFSDNNGRVKMALENR